MDVSMYNVFSRVERQHWWFVGRRKIFQKVLQKYLQENEKVLDVGCGTGGNMLLLKQYGEVHGVDMSDEALQYAKTAGYTSLTKADGASMPITENSFDAVFAIDVLEHIDNDVQALKEWLRVVKPGGIVFLSVPAFQFLWSYHDTLNHHKRRYTKSSLRHCVSSIGGTRIEKVQYYNVFLAPIIFIIRLVERFTKKQIQHAHESPTLAIPWKLINWSLKKIVASERYFSWFPFPFGVSIFIIIKKV